MQFLTDRKRTTGLGSAKDGTEHLWQTKVTSVALVILTPLFIFMFGAHLGKDHGTVLAVYGNPMIALIAILMILVTFYHLKLGLQLVIEDYISNHLWRTVAMLGNIFLCYAAMAAGTFAIAKIAFGA
ncbi:MAG: succinate dehydrogenase, hydrophobic membrane anchor protein [Pseudomonadota bacterium]